MRHYILILILVSFFISKLAGQSDTEYLSGQVSFVSPGSVYVKFKSTNLIKTGDTLFIPSGGDLEPALIVENLSSLSCVCSLITSATPAVADFVFARVERDKGKPEVALPDTLLAAIPDAVASKDTVRTKSDVNKHIQQVSGSVSVHSYSDFSTAPAGNLSRFRYTLSLNVRNISDSKLSVESYISFRHKPGEWDEVKDNIFNALKIFNLALLYDPNKSTRISVGRKINPKLSNTGAIDGIQAEKSFGRFAVGALAGTRPDYSDYGFNSDLLQFGGYLGFNTGNKSRYSESSVAIMQQMNGPDVDRRFIYFQHSGSIVKNVYFSGTFEADLYKLEIDTVNNTERSVTGFDPTGLYLSLRYRASQKISISGSYDARKNVIYYETYKTFLDRMLEDEMRQGFRLQASYRITRDLSSGLQAGYRFMKPDPRPSRNLYGYLTYNNIPGLDVAATISGTYLESGYMTGRIYAANLSRDLAKGKLQTSIGYRYFDYTFPENSTDNIQHIGEINLFWHPANKISLSINYEGTFEKENKYHRLYFQIRKRF